MSENSAVPFGRKPRDWILAWRFSVAVLAAVGAVAGGVFLFAGKAYVKEAAAAEMAPVAALPSRIIILETERARQDRDQRAMNTTIAAIREDVAAIKATQAANAENNNRNMTRIMDRLDAIARQR